MLSRIAFFAALMMSAISLPIGAAEQAPAKPPADPVAQRAVMTGEQVVQILDETVDWYRTLGTQQQAATQPSDLLILYANRQTADKVMALAFEIGRANAELISSEAGVKQEQQEASSPEEQSLSRIKKKLDDQRTELQGEIEGVRRQIAAAAGKDREELQARLAVLQGELELINARRNLFSNMTQYASETTGANTLKAHIDAIAASIPASVGPVMTTTTSTPGAG